MDFTFASTLKSVEIGTVDCESDVFNYLNNSKYINYTLLIVRAGSGSLISSKSFSLASFEQHVLWELASLSALFSISLCFSFSWALFFLLSFASLTTRNKRAAAANIQEILNTPWWLSKKPFRVDKYCLRLSLALSGASPGIFLTSLCMTRYPIIPEMVGARPE